MNVSNSPLSGIAVHPHQEFIAIASDSGSVFSLQLNKVLERASCAVNPTESTDENVRGSANTHCNGSYDDSLPKIETSFSTTQLQAGHGSAIVGAGMLLDNCIASVDANGSILVWSVHEESIGLDASFYLGVPVVCATCTSRNGGMLALGGQSGDLRLVQPVCSENSVDSITSLYAGFQRRMGEDAIEHLDFSPDGALLAASTSNGQNQLAVFDCCGSGKGASMRALLNISDGLTSICWLHAGSSSSSAELILAIAKSCAAVELFSFTNIDFGARATRDQSLVECIQVPSPALCMSQAPQAGRLIAGAADGSAYIIDIESSQCAIQSQVLNVHAPYVSVAAAGPTAALGSEDGRVTLLSSESLEVSATYRLHSGIEGIGCLTGLWPVQNSSIVCGGQDGVLNRLIPLRSKKGRLWKPRAYDLSAMDVPVRGIATELSSVEPEEDIERRARLAAERDQAARRLQGRCSELSSRLLSTLEENDHAENYQQLKGYELIIDTERCKEILSRGDDEARATRQQCREENLRRDLLSRRIRNAMKDGMEQLWYEILPFGQHSNCVRSYSLRKRTQRQLIALRRIKFLRRTERFGWATQAPAQGSKAVLARIASEQDSEERHSAEPKTPSTTGSPRESNSSHAGVQGLLYRSTELHSPWRRVAQVHLLKDRQREVRKAFNNECHRLSNRKQADMGKIREKKRRLAEIAFQLGIQQPDDIAGEETRGHARVADQDGDDEEEENVPQQRHRGQNSGALHTASCELGEAEERGLQKMMGGMLERSRLDEYAESLEREPWMDKPQEDMTKDEVQKLKEYEERVQAYEEERVRVRKALETEHRQLQAEIEQIAKYFDSAWMEAFASQQAHERTVLQCDQTALLLCTTASGLYSLQESVQSNESNLSALTAKVESMEAFAEVLKEEESKASSQGEALERKLRQIMSRFRKEYGNYEVYEQLRSVFMNSSAPFSQRRGPSSRGNWQSNAAGLSAGPPTSTRRRSNIDMHQGSERDGTRSEKAHVDEPEEMGIRRPSELDVFRRQNSNKKGGLESITQEPFSDADKPEGFDDAVWASVLAIRDHRLLKEAELERVNAMHQDAQIELQVQQEKLQQLRQQKNDVEQHKAEEQRQLKRELHNALVLLEMKQRNVEIDMTEPIPAFNDSSLIDKSVVEELNSRIQAKGSEKLQILETRKRERNEIVKLEWSTQEADMQLEDVSSRIRELQLLHLTKSLQMSLAESAPEQKQHQQEQRLQQRMQEEQRINARKVAQKREKLRRMQRAMKQLDYDNGLRDSTIDTLAQSESLRGRMADRTSNAQTVSEYKRKMRHVRSVHKLAEIAKQQKTEIQALRDELERLKKRTGPTLPPSGGMVPTVYKGGLQL